MADEIVKDVVYRIRLQIDEGITPKPQGILASGGVSPVMPSPVGMTAAGVSDSVRMATETGNITRELSRLASVLQGVTSHIDATTRASVAQAKAASVPVPGRPDWYHGAIGAGGGSGWGADPAETYRLNSRRQWNGVEWSQWNGSEWVFPSRTPSGPYGPPKPQSAMFDHVPTPWDFFAPGGRQRAGGPQYSDFITDAMMQAGRQYGPQHYSSSIPGGAYGPRAPMMHRMSQWMRGAWDGVSNIGTAMTGGFSPRSLTALPHDMNSLGWMLNSGNTLGAISYGAQVAPGYLSRLGPLAGPVGIGVAAVGTYSYANERLATSNIHMGNGYGDPYAQTRIGGSGISAWANAAVNGWQWPTEQEASLKRIRAGLPAYSAATGTSSLTPSQVARAMRDRSPAIGLEWLSTQSMANLADRVGLGGVYDWSIGRPRYRNEGTDMSSRPTIGRGTNFQEYYDLFVAPVTRYMWGGKSYEETDVEAFGKAKYESMMAGSAKRLDILRRTGSLRMADYSERFSIAGAESSYGMEEIGAQLRGRRTSAFDDPMLRFGFRDVSTVANQEIAASRGLVGDYDKMLSFEGRAGLTATQLAEARRGRADAIGMQRDAIGRQIGVREQMIGMYEQQGAISGNWMLRYGTMAPNERVVLKGISEQVKDNGVGSLNQWELEYAAGTGQSRLAQEELRRRYKGDAEDIRKVLSPNLTPEQAKAEAAARERDFAGTDYGDTTKMAEKFRREIETLTADMTTAMKDMRDAMIEAMKAAAAAATEAIGKGDAKPKATDASG